MPDLALFHPDELLAENHDGVLVLTINRLFRYNAWTSDLRDELARRLLQADADPAVTAVILTGAGDQAFCSGQDLWEMQAYTDGAPIGEWLDRLTRCYDAVRRFGKPLVAAVNGVAAGSGFQVTQFCDLVIVHPEVRMGQTEVNSGLPSIFGTWLMWERIGRRAIELSLQARLMDADEARQLGFVNEIVPASQVLERAIAVARRMAQQPVQAFSMSKRANWQLDEDRYRNALALAAKAYREAFDAGMPQRQIEKFFEERRARKALG